MSSLLNKLNTKKLPAILQCPLCDYHIKRNTMFEAHVLQEHGISAKELYIQQHSQGVNKCKCGCGGEPKWIGYNVGFAKFIVGHNANIYSSYDEETAKKIALTRGFGGFYVSGKKINHGANRQTTIYVPYVTVVRLLIVMIETGLRGQNVQWLDRLTWDSLNKDSGPIDSLYTALS